MLKILIPHHVSHVTYHVSLITCHGPRVTWHHYSQTVRSGDLKCWDNVHKGRSEVKLLLKNKNSQADYGSMSIPEQLLSTVFDYRMYHFLQKKNGLKDCLGNYKITKILIMFEPLSYICKLIKYIPSMAMLLGDSCNTCNTGTLKIYDCQLYHFGTFKK